MTMSELDFPCIICGASEAPHMPGCGGEEQSEEQEEQVNGETGDVDVFPEGTSEGASSVEEKQTAPEPSTDGLNINKDPTTLSSEELVWTVNTIRKKVLDNVLVSDAEIAYSIKCIAIMRSHRPASGKAVKEKVTVKQMGLDDF